jgi:glutathione S-transferase
MITVHHLENSRSQRVLWLLEELGLEYQVKRYERDPATNLAPASLKKIHPLGKSPVITDDKRTVAETGAIVEYVVDYHAGGKLAPEPGSEARLRYTYWLHYAEGSLMPWLVMSLIFGRLSKPPMPLPLRPVAGLIAGGVQTKFLQKQIATHLDFLEDELGKHTWFTGEEFSAADIMMSFPLEAAAARAGLDASRPNLSRFLSTIHARGAYKRALERGGPYELMK